MKKLPISPDHKEKDAEEYRSSAAAFVFPPPVTEALRRLRGAGYEAYAVGGCVRDLLRGAAPSDYDLTTSALPEQIRAVFKGEKTVDTGLKHGTLTVILSGMPLEITTYRLEGTYSDHRHPDGVIFTASLREDLARRDFTVNAMGATEDGQIADFFGGRRDLAARLLRCVGEPEKRFREDALRILRALRFASGLGFGVERETLAAAERCAPLLAYVSAERIREELFRLLLGADAEKALSFGGKILRTVLPECFGEDGEPAEGLCALLPRLPQDLILRLAALFYGEGERQDPVKTAEAVLTRLKTDGKTKKQTITLLESRNLPLQSDGDLLIACGRLSPGGAERLLTLKGAAARARGEDGGLYEAGKRRLAALLAEGRCYRLRELALDGSALRLLGVPEGKAVGEMLAALLEGVIRGKYENTPDALAGAVREMLSEK